MMFAGIQNGPYNGPHIEALIRQIRDFGVKAVGQSSWGPCVFAITRNDEDAQRLVGHLQSEYGDRCTIQTAKADNEGAKTFSRDSMGIKQH
jgi:predicted sugar kinase